MKTLRLDLVRDEILVETLLEIDLKFERASFSIDDLVQKEVIDGKNSQSFQRLINAGCLDHTDQMYTLTTAAREYVESLPTEWVIRHLPLECHAAQK